MITKIDKNRTNNFDFLRLLLATLVIFSHSYPLSGNQDPLYVYSKSQLTLGEFAVDSFFIISGYLIINSLKSSRSILNYFWKRIIRIFPALMGVSILTLFVIPFVYEGNQLFNENSYWLYLPKNLLLFFTPHINGVFEQNPFPKSINGSLWTLRYEFVMYIITGALFALKAKRILPLFIGILFIASFIFNVIDTSVFNSLLRLIRLNPESFFHLAAFFFGGALLTFINLNRKFRNLYILIFFIPLLAALHFEIYYWIAPFCLPMIIIILGKQNIQSLSKLSNRYGDISYGVYIYGFITQQTIVYFLKLSPCALTGLTLIIVCPISYFSWVFIEKKALMLKNIF